MTTLKQLRDHLNTYSDSDLEANIRRVDVDSISQNPAWDWKNDRFTYPAVKGLLIEAEKVIDKRSTKEFNEQYLNSDILEIVPVRTQTLVIRIEDKDEEVRDH